MGQITSQMRTVVLGFFVILASAHADEYQESEDKTSEAPIALTDVTVTDQRLVVLNETASSDSLASEVAALGGAVDVFLKEINVAIVSGMTDAGAAKLAASDYVETINQDLLVQLWPELNTDGVLLSSLDPMDQSMQQDIQQSADQSLALRFDSQWNIRQIDADDAWTTTNAGSGTLVCIVDTGIDPYHQELVGKVDFERSVSFIPTEPDWLDYSFHDVGADVINLSLGAYRKKHVDMSGDQFNPADSLFKATKRAVEYANKKGTLVIAAAGNIGMNLDEGSYHAWPVEIKGVMGVGATGPINQTNFDNRAIYSNYGKKAVDIMAPGGGYAPGGGNGVREDKIVSPCSQFSIHFNCQGGNKYLGLRGTSMAAPHVSGAAAVVASELRETNNSSKSRQSTRKIARCIKNGADNVGDKSIYSSGRLNVLGALACLQEDQE